MQYTVQYTGKMYNIQYNVQIMYSYVFMSRNEVVANNKSEKRRQLISLLSTVYNAGVKDGIYFV